MADKVLTPDEHRDEQRDAHRSGRVEPKACNGKLKHVIESQQFTVPLLMELFDRSRGMERVVARGKPARSALDGNPFPIAIGPFSGLRNALEVEAQVTCQE